MNVAPRRPAAPPCGGMEQACRENLAESDRDMPFAEENVLKAQDYVRFWTEAMGKLEQAHRQRNLSHWNDRVAALRSDRRYWLMRAQAWRDCLALHPELRDQEVGAKCAHGYIAPMCIIDQPVLKRGYERQREPGEDDE